jgi:phosphoribosyl 1,2-cyclic phosphodiesterase
VAADSDRDKDDLVPAEGNIAKGELGWRVCMLASGSRGNAIYLSAGRTAILFDAGLSGKELERRMLERQISPAGLTAIVVSHEHSDHIRGVGVLSRRYKLPVYISPATGQAAASQLGSLHQVRPFHCGANFQINDVVIHPFSISHDANDPAGFTVNHNGGKIGIATDLGMATGMVIQHLQRCDMLILESNHDLQMLIDGPYPWHLKQRIKGRSGHLSNTDAMQLLKEIQHSRLAWVILAHLSEQNNHPEKALQTVRQAMDAASCNPRFYVAAQDVSSEVLSL